MRKTHFLFATLFAMTMAIGLSPATRPVAFAEEQPAATAETDPVAATPQRLSLVDRRMVPCLSIDSDLEVELAVFASTRAHDTQVKQFAESVAKNYGAFTKTLDERAAAQAASSGKKPVPVAGASESGKTASRPPMNLLNPEKTLMRIKTDIAQEWTAAMRQELEVAPPAEFDVRYMRAMVFRQIQTLSTLKVFNGYASPALSPLLDQELKSIQADLDAARSILARLESPTAPSTAVIANTK